jgi:hypothetical protein
MRDVGRVNLGPSVLSRQAGAGAHLSLLQRWRAWAPLLGIGVAALVVGLSGGKRTAHEPSLSLQQRVDVEVAQDRATAWRPSAPEPVVETPVTEPAQASPGGKVLRMMGPPLVIEVRVPRAKARVAKK